VGAENDLHLARSRRRNDLQGDHLDGQPPGAPRRSASVQPCRHAFPSAHRRSAPIVQMKPSDNCSAERGYRFNQAAKGRWEAMALRLMTIPITSPSAR